MAPPSAPPTIPGKPAALADLSDDDQWFAGVMDRSKAVQVRPGWHPVREPSHHLYCVSCLCTLCLPMVVLDDAVSALAFDLAHT